MPKDLVLEPVIAGLMIPLAVEFGQRQDPKHSQAVVEGHQHNTLLCNHRPIVSWTARSAELEVNTTNEPRDRA